jgi:hypothetical protein
MILAFLEQQGPGVLAHHCQGRPHQRRLHCEGPGLVHEAAQEEKAVDGGPAVVVPLGQSSGAHRGSGPGVTGHPQRPGDPAPAVFA